MLVTKLDALKIAKEKLDYLVSERKLKVDPQFEGYFESLHAVTSDIIPVYSCEGHRDDPKWNTPYVMFYFTEHGKNILEHTLEHMADKLTELGLSLTPNELKITHRLYAIEDENKLFTPAINWVYNLPIKSDISEAICKEVVKIFKGTLMNIVLEDEKVNKGNTYAEICRKFR